MNTQPLRYSKEEFAQRGNEIYEAQVRPQIEEGNFGKIVAIDIETGSFELANDTIAASFVLQADCPSPNVKNLEKPPIRVTVHRYSHRWNHLTNRKLFL